MDLKRLIKKWEKEYKAEKKLEVQEVYNKIVDAIRGASFTSVIAALKLVEMTIICKKLKETYPELFKD